MENPLDQFIRSTREVRLSEAAKTRIRAHLLKHIRGAHPPAPLRSPYVPFLARLSPLSRPLIALPLFFLIVVGGVGVGATGALPGDPLYALKVGVLEPTRGFLILSPEAKALWHIELTEVRLREIETLIERDSLTSEESEKIRERFHTSLQAVEENLEKLSEKSPDVAEKIRDSFSRAIDAREEALTTGSASTSKGSAVLRSLLERSTGEVRGAQKSKKNSRE